MCNLQPSTRVPFSEYIETVREVVDAADYFFLKRDGIFDAMPACWKHLLEPQRREVAALIKAFYDESLADPSKDPWSVDNIKKYLNLGYVKLDDTQKFRAAYLASLGDESIFVTPVVEDKAATTSTSSKLLDDHDAFALRPKKLVTHYQGNRSDSKAQGKLFVHMTNFVCTEHVTANKKREVSLQLEPSPSLNVEMSHLQKSLLNPNSQDVMLSELIDQAQGQRAKKKEAKRRQDVINGNIGSYSAILNTEENLEMVKDYNNLAASLGMLSAEKDAKSEESAKKKKEEAAEKAAKKAGKEAEEITKRHDLLPGFLQELEQNDISGIIGLADSRMRLYIRYFFQEKVVNLSKTKKDKLQEMLQPLLVQHYAANAAAEEDELALATDEAGHLV